MNATAEMKDKNPQLLLFSANTQESLKQLVNNCQAYLERHPERLSDISNPLSLRRERLPHRAFAVIANGCIADVSPSIKLSGSIPQLVMISSGQGAQWPEMGRDLIEKDRNFREDILAMDDILQGLEYPPKWTTEVKQESLNARNAFLTPIKMNFKGLPRQVSFISLNWLNHSVPPFRLDWSTPWPDVDSHPDAVIGHSSGYIAAAYATGALSTSEAIIVAYYRGYITKKQKLIGGMATIDLDMDATSEFSVDGMVIACQNSPNSTTISGNLLELEKVVGAIEKQRPDVLARQLKVDMAYHSRNYLRCGGLLYANKCI